MAREERCILTNMCMVYNGRYVLVQDKVNPSWGGVTFPGGHVEPGEAFTDAVIREVQEETGLVISAPRLCGVKDWTEDGVRYVVLCYKADKFAGDVLSSPEGDVHWISLCDFKHQRLAPGMDTMLQVFLKEDVSEHFISQENGQWVETLK